MTNYSDLLATLTPEEKLQIKALALQHFLHRQKQSQTQEWSPLLYQSELTASSAIVRGIIGGNRTGKTEWGARETYYYLTGTHPSRRVQVPVEIWIGTPSFDTQVETTQPKLLKFIGDAIKDCRVEYYQGNKIKTIYFPNGSKVTFKSYEQATDKWAGAEKRLIWFDEEPPRNIWNEAIVRQGRDVQLDIIFTMTPVMGMTWFYDEIYQQAEAKGIVIKTPRWEDNPHISAEQVRQMESMLSAEELEVRKFGRFVRKVGMVAPWWRRDLHIQDLSSFDPRSGTIYVAIDFGFASSNLCAMFACIRGNDIYIFDGIYEKGLTTPALAQRLKEKLGSLYVNKWIGDSEAASDIEELRHHGFNIQPIKKTSGDKADAWDDFRARKMQEAGAINQFTGQARLHVSKDLIVEQDGRYLNWFANEFENVMWKSVRTADGMKAKATWSDDKPKDAMDAFSYIVVSIPGAVEVKYHQQFEMKKQVPKEILFDDDGFYL